MHDEDVLGLDAAAAAMFDDARNDASLKAACDALHAACLAQLPPLAAQATALEAGHALSPADAANCLLDPLRTTRLVRALDARIAARHAQAGAVHVLYAGCGPLAPLALLVARRWRGRGVQFDLVDVHAQAIDSATRLFALAGAAGMIHSARCADAATLQLEARASRPDILLAEVMQHALIREPQVAVVANLLPQCAPDAALVPDRIVVSAALARAAEQAMPRRDLGTLLVLSAGTVPAIGAALRVGAVALPEITLQVPADVDGAHDVMLATRIEAGPGEILDGDDSGLTAPLFAFAAGQVRAGDVLGFRYRLGRDPGFAIRRIGPG